MQHFLSMEMILKENKNEIQVTNNFGTHKNRVNLYIWTLKLHFMECDIKFVVYVARTLVLSPEGWETCEMGKTNLEYCIIDREVSTRWKNY